jgi:hypothetical protein
MTPAASDPPASSLAIGVRLAWGALLCAVPGRILKLMGGADEGVVPRRVMRVLGARHVIQGLAEHRYGGAARRLGVVADLLHAATDVGFGVRDPRWRRAAFTDAVIAGAFAFVGLRGRKK